MVVGGGFAFFCGRWPQHDVVSMEWFAHRESLSAGSSSPAAFSEFGGGDALAVRAQICYF